MKDIHRIEVEINGRTFMITKSVNENKWVAYGAKPAKYNWFQKLFIPKRLKNRRRLSFHSISEAIEMTIQEDHQKMLNKILGDPKAS